MGRDAGKLIFLNQINKFKGRNTPHENLQSLRQFNSVIL